MLRELISEIREEPEADGPRLVAADFISATDPARAEYIVASIQGREDRERHLEDQHAMAWSRPLIALGARPRYDALTFTRGFVESIALYNDASLAFARMCELEPLVELLLSDPDPGIGAQRELAQVRELTLMTEAVGVLASPHLTGVETIAFPIDFGITDAWTLARSVIRPKRLHCVLDPQIARVLATNGVLDNLVALERLDIDEATLLAVAATPLAHLEALVLRPYLPSRAAIDALGLRLDKLTKFHYLSPPAGLVGHFVRYMPSGNLRDASFVGYDDDSLIELLESPACANLERLAIGGWNMSDRMIAAVERLAAGGRLRHVITQRPIDLPLGGR